MTMSVLHMFFQLILLWLTICTEKLVTSEKNNREGLPHFHCHADQIMKEHYHQNKNASKEMQLFEIKTRQLISMRKSPGSYVIPVVFHVYGTDFSGQSVNDMTIIKAVEKLNEDFHGLNADFNTVHPGFQGIRATFDVTFKLARKDPNGNPTTGIIYYPAKNGYGTLDFNSDIQREAWDNYKYCNVYIQSDIYGNGAFTSSGVAWYPGTDMSNANLARIVYNGGYLYGNTNDEFSSVLTHEFGHWLNLLHTFFDDCASSFENQCTETGDRVCDTPATDGSQGCAAFNNCFGKLVNSENYMDYSGAYGCYKMFTAGQVARMEAAMSHPARITLWQHENLVATGLVDDNTDCSIDFCQSGGTCVINGNTPSCICPSTHTGQQCETLIPTTTTSTQGPSKCTSSTCLNGGSCFDIGNDFICLCTAQYSGRTCNTQNSVTTPFPTTTPGANICSTNPCNNGGSCYKYGSTFVCVCTSQFTGLLCDMVKATVTSTNTTPSSTITCANQPCQNGGTCYNAGNSYFCYCGTGSNFTGKNCESPIVVADSTSK